MVAVDENLLSFAKELFKKANEEKAALANLASGENPPTGAAVPAYFADTPNIIIHLPKFFRRRHRVYPYKQSGKSEK